MAHYSRRDFRKTGLAAAALAGAGSLPLRAARETATDWVTLGKSGAKMTRLAFGTGSLGGRVQRAGGAYVPTVCEKILVGARHGVPLPEFSMGYTG